MSGQRTGPFSSLTRLTYVELTELERASLVPYESTSVSTRLLRSAVNELFNHRHDEHDERDVARLADVIRGYIERNGAPPLGATEQLVDLLLRGRQ